MAEEKEETQEITPVTNNDIVDFINSTDFKDTVEDAKKSRLEIMNDLSPEMKSYREEFVDYMLDNADSDMDDETKKEMTKMFKKNFKKVVDYQHYLGGWPKPDSEAKLEVLAKNVEVALKYLDFAQNPEFRNRLAAHGIYIDDSKTTKLTDDYKWIKPDTWTNFKNIIDSGDKCQGSICQTADNIKINIFESKIPDELRYSKENKIGIKPTTFNKLVTTAAMKDQKTDEKMQKYLTNLTENSCFNIAREEILQEGYRTIDEA